MGMGEFQSSGSLRMDALNLNLSYAYNDFNLKNTQNIFPLSLFGLKDGWISSNGTISTSGDSLDEVFYNLYTKSTFVGKNLIWDNFNVDKLIDNSFIIKITKPLIYSGRMRNIICKWHQQQ
jgi:hypothetical protein